MAVFVRAKRVTDPLNDKVKARLTGYVSSGSEYEAADLSGFFHGFFLDKIDGTDTDAPTSAGEEEEDDDEGSDKSVKGRRGSSSSSSPPAAMIRDLLNPASCSEDDFRRDLVADVSEAVDRLGRHGPSGSVFRRAVMGSLRESGYNAGLCKARWESGGGITGGSYEYIDVMRSSLPGSDEAKEELIRYIVDVDFAGEFEIARPTAEYRKVAAALPPVLVGRAEELKQVVKLVAEAAKRSLRSREMHVPPWRKARYMQAKWLGSYRRTTNAVLAATSSLGPGRDVQCRSVGFDTAGLVISAVTRTR